MSQSLTALNVKGFSTDDLKPPQNRTEPYNSNTTSYTNAASILY
jgi:hypothetical protein